MEIMQWLEPSIKEGVVAVEDICQQHIADIDLEFRKAFNRIRDQHPEAFGDLLILEAVYAKKDEIIGVSYRQGFKDCYQLAGAMKPR